MTADPTARSGPTCSPATTPHPVRRADGSYDITLWDVSTTTSTAPTTTYGNDTIYGGDVALTSGADRDRIFAQGGDDVVSGGSDADYVEGNVGADHLLGRRRRRRPRRWLVEQRRPAHGELAG